MTTGDLGIAVGDEWPILLESIKSAQDQEYGHLVLEFARPISVQYVARHMVEYKGLFK